MSNSKELDIDLIKEGFEMFDIENKGIIDPFELKETLEEMNLKEKNIFLYEFISSLCNTKEIKSKGGITLEEFIDLFKEKLSDVETEKGIKHIFNTFSDVDDKIPMSSFYQVGKEIGDEDNYIEIKKLIEMSKTGEKELTFDEFYNIMKDCNEKKKKYYYQNYAYKGYLKNNNKTFQNNRYSQNLEETNSSNEFKRYHRKYRGQKSGGDFYNNKSDNIDRNLVYIQFKK